MADPRVDCKRIPELISQINQTSAELGKLRAEMDELGFGTAKTLRLIVKLYNFIAVLEKVPDTVFLVLYDFVRCNNDRLADLTLDQLKQLVRVLIAHAELQIESIPDEKIRTPEQAALLKAFQEWLPELNNIAAQFAMVSKDALIALITAAKQLIKKAAPKVLELLIEVFGDELKQAIVTGAIKILLNKKTLFRTLAQQVVKAALGKAAAKTATPWINVALTGWELIVEVAGASAATDLREYLDKLLVALVMLMKGCGWKWPQSAAADPDGNQSSGFYVKGERYKGASVVARPFIRCAKVVDGKPQFAAACPVKFVSGATISVKLTEENRTGERWEVLAAIDMTSVQNAPCITDAKYCYAYLQLRFTFADGKKTTMNIICGVQTFP